MCVCVCVCVCVSGEGHLKAPEEGVVEMVTAVLLAVTGGTSPSALSKDTNSTVFAVPQKLRTVAVGSVMVTDP